MKNSTIFKDSLQIILYLMREVFHQLFSSSFFQKKRNQWFVVLLIVIGYGMYFGLNILVIRDLRAGIEQSMVTMELKRNLFSSITNVFIWMTGILFLLIESSFALTNKGLYVIKTLPFEPKSQMYAVKWLKEGIAYLIFLTLFTILASSFQLFYFTTVEFILFMFYSQGVFFFTYVFFTAVYHGMLRKLPKMRTIIIVVFLTFYFESWKYKIDFWVMKQMFLVDGRFILQ